MTSNFAENPVNETVSHVKALEPNYTRPLELNKHMLSSISFKMTSFLDFIWLYYLIITIGQAEKFVGFARYFFASF